MGGTSSLGAALPSNLRDFTADCHASSVEVRTGRIIIDPNPFSFSFGREWKNPMVL
jgi:hypothetical protein